MKKASIWIGISILASIIGAIVERVFLESEILDWLLSALLWIFNSLLFILNYELPIWAILSGLATIALFAWFFKFWRPKALREVIKYDEEEFFGIKFTWTWKHNWGKGFDINGLHAHCDDDETILVIRTVSSDHDPYSRYETFQCPRCQKNFDHAYSNLNRVEPLIRDNARRIIAKKPHQREVVM